MTYQPLSQILLLALLTLSIGCSKNAEGGPERGTGPGGNSSLWPDALASEGRGSDTSADNPWLKKDKSPLLEEGELPGTESPGEGEAQQKLAENLEFELSGVLDEGENSASSAEEVAQELLDTGSPNRSEDSELQEEDVTPRIPVELELREYFEGTGSQKSLTLFNRGANNAEECVVEVYSNGGDKPWRTLVLPAVISPGQGVVLCTKSLEDPLCTHPMTGSPYNGNDALVVRCREELVDSLGRVGEDPGAAWEEIEGPISTKDRHLLRCPGELDRDPTDSFHVEEDWVVLDSEAGREAALALCLEKSSLAYAAGGAGAD